ncbi:hypothetical protein SAY87_019786 [Trapa incisa]|uniref:DUF8204 domain-containing protein n=1 Tax=Trapa incisa TaxID=236973 RepID=A0AAN7K8F9_9MYRT|nr:hypothetical protein SAY87_019786 [Trapa incisa]
MGAEEELKVKADDAGEGARSPHPPPNQCPNASVSPTNSVGGFRGKSCKGCLYYSSNQRSISQRPTCVGISRSLQQVPRYVVGETESQASKEGRTLLDFRYACIGYSVFLEKNGQPSDQQKKEAELPFCVGLEVLLDKRTTPTPQVQEHARKNEDYHTFRQQRTHEPANTIADDYLSRFTRSATLVASGVAKNANKVGNHIKETINDILYPYGKRSK